MDAPKAAVRVSTLAVAGLLVALLAVSLWPRPAAAQPAPLMDETGTSEFVFTREPGVHPAQWRSTPVLVFVVPQARLDGVERLRGLGEATDAHRIGDGLAVFVLSAKSTDMGCTVRFNTNLGASRDIADYDGDGAPDGRLLDPCHQGQWDIYRQGRHVPGTPTNERDMASLRFELLGTRITGLGFDGPVGPPR